MIPELITSETDFAYHNAIIFIKEKRRHLPPIGMLKFPLRDSEKNIFSHTVIPRISFSATCPEGGCSGKGFLLFLTFVIEDQK
jgi:hypothetical protein